jgi:hypothetical protein
MPRVGERAALEDKADLMPCYGRVGDVSRRLLSTKYRGTNGRLRLEASVAIELARDLHHHATLVTGY